MKSEVQRWADVAMFEAEPAPGSEDGVPLPQVTLLSMTPNPLGVMAAAAELYRGHVVRDPSELTQEQIWFWFREMSKTKLQAPFEFIDLHFLIENVTRAFTHQLVRQRTAVFVQESMRFAVKERAAWEVGLPPSIASLREDHPWRVIWQKAVNYSSNTYRELIDSGVPAEDARGLLPTNIVTRVHYKTNLRNLAEHAGLRLCTQAQFEWRQVWALMLKAIREYTPNMMAADINRHRWQYEQIAGLFRPVCFTTGKCEFMGDNDRACSIRERVNSGRWSDIRPGEWLLDPSAARVAPGE